MNLKHVYWIAGLLEGEGCFGFYNNCPSVQINMKDLDIVEKARLILDKNGFNKIRTANRGGNRNLMYCLSVSGNIAIQWMMTIYPLMGIRRKAKIREVIQAWKERIEQTTEIRSRKGHEQQAVKAIAISRKISYVEAKVIFDGLMNPVKSEQVN